jgi:phenylacetate-CoA ligase
MSGGLKRRLAKRFGCPVIDWYSLTETGPIGCACPRGGGYHVLPHDLYVEAIDADGRPVPDGRRGEIAVSGGRNPYLPLLRYRTGDWGRLEAAPCACGDPAVRILDLEGRKPVLYRTSQGAIVNPVDLSRILRAFPLVQHAFTQRADRSCELVVRPIPGVPPPAAATLANAVRSLLGGDTALEVRFDPRLGDRAAGGKVEPYRSELLLED